MELNLSLPNEQARKFNLQKLFIKKLHTGPQGPDNEQFTVTIEDEKDLLNFWISAWSVGYGMCTDIVDKIRDSKPVTI